MNFDSVSLNWTTNGNQWAECGDHKRMMVVGQGCTPKSLVFSPAIQHQPRFVDFLSSLRCSTGSSRVYDMYITVYIYICVCVCMYTEIIFTCLNIHVHTCSSYGTPPSEFSIPSHACLIRPFWRQPPSASAAPFSSWALEAVKNPNVNVNPRWTPVD